MSGKYELCWVTHITHNRVIYGVYYVVMSANFLINCGDIESIRNKKQSTFSKSATYLVAQLKTSSGHFHMENGKLDVTDWVIYVMSLRWDCGN